MLSLLVSVLAVLAVPSPVPSASAPAASQLKEIGHVEAHSACAQIVTHANTAIGDALANDSDLALTINRLRTTDLDDDNAIKRRNGMNDLETLASRIRMSAQAGNRDVKALRALVAQTTQPERKAELKAFTDALAGAIARQRIAATHLDSLLVTIDGRRAVADVESQELTGVNASLAADPDVRMPHTASQAPPTYPVAAQPTAVDGMLRDMADDFQTESKAILGDEATAAEHTDGATAGC